MSSMFPIFLESFQDSRQHWPENPVVSLRSTTGYLLKSLRDKDGCQDKTVNGNRYPR